MLVYDQNADEYRILIEYVTNMKKVYLFSLYHRFVPFDSDSYGTHMV